MTNRFYGLFDGLASIISEYAVKPNDIQPATEEDVLFASYRYEDYSGSSDVVFRHEGKLYHVNGGHCSCYGLEGQWEPEEMPPAALAKLEYGWRGEELKGWKAMIAEIGAS